MAVVDETRRARLRRELIADILRIARRQLTEAGPSAVTWRAIARELGMNPASLYTYFDSLDALFTALIKQSYESLAAAVHGAFDASVDAPSLDHAVATAHGFRAWAVDHRAEFNLIFTDQLPGYAAPVDGGTFEAEMNVLRPLVRSIAGIVGRELDPADMAPGDPVAEAALGVWATLHGLVMLEVNNHLPPADGRERFDRIVRAALEVMPAA